MPAKKYQHVSTRIADGIMIADHVPSASKPPKSESSAEGLVRIDPETPALLPLSKRSLWALRV